MNVSPNPRYMREPEGLSRARTLVRELNSRYARDVLLAGAELVPSTTHPLVWRELDAVSLRWIADFPILLLTLRFDDHRWWASWAHGGKAGRPENAGACGALSPAAGLARHVLTAAWRTAHCLSVAMLLFGMSQTVAKVIAALELRDIDRIASACYGELRPRWASNQRFWPALLYAARERDQQRWFELELHAVHLLGRDLLAADADSLHNELVKH